MKIKKILAIQITLIMLIDLFLPYLMLLTKSYNKTLIVPNPTTIIEPITEEWANGKLKPNKIHNNVTSIIIKTPTKTTYMHGEELDLAGGTITINYDNGVSNTVIITKDMITEVDGTKSVNMRPNEFEYDSITHRFSKSVQITYTDASGVTVTKPYTFDIINDIKSISVYGDKHKIIYNVKEPLDIMNLEILVRRAIGTSIVAVTDPSMISGFKNDKSYEDLPLTITYSENGIYRKCHYTTNVM